MFQHDGQRSPETDRIAEELARCAVLDQWPDAQQIELTWVHHNQPDTWLVFAIGRTSPNDQ